MELSSELVAELSGGHELVTCNHTNAQSLSLWNRPVDGKLVLLIVTPKIGHHSFILLKIMK